MRNILALFLLLSIASISAFATVGFTKLSTEEAKKLHDEGNALFIDARGYKLYQKGTIIGAMNIPTSKYKQIKGFLPADKHALIVSFCNGIKCEKSEVLADMLQEDGYTNIKVYPDGYPGWKQTNLPVMGLLKECKESKSTEAYKPEKEAVTVNGVTLYPGEDEGMIDQFWFAGIVNDLPKGIRLVDVRKADQFKEGHLKGAINIPFDSEKSTMDISKIPSEGLVVFYCNTGMMSTDAFTSLESLKFKGGNVMYFDANINCKGTECTIEPNEPL